MHPIAQQLMNAQLQFVLKELSGDALSGHLHNEANAYCDLLERISVRQLFSEEVIAGWIERNILGYEPTEALRQQAVMLVEMGLNNPNHQQMPMRQLINRQIYDFMVERLVSRPALRSEVIHSVLGSPIYHRMLSDLLFHAIQDYLLTENPLSRNVPGMSSLLKAGKGMMGKIGNLEQTMETTLKKYLQANVKSTAAFSESLVNKALNEDQLRAFADQLWPHLEAYELGQASRHLEIEGLSYMAMVFWNQIRQTDFMRQQVAYLIKGWYAHAGDQKAMDVLLSLGITRKQIVREVVAVGTPLVNAWVESGYFERRIAEHLESFFNSPETTALLSGSSV